MEDHSISDEQRSARADEAWWKTIGTLYRRKGLIIGLTGGMAILSVVLSLLLPNWYKASSRLLLSDSGSGGISAALLGNLSSAAQSLLGSSGGDYVRYLAILNSRSVLASVVDTFDLVTVYGEEDSDEPFEEALETLEDNIDFVIDDEYDFLSVEVLDKDPNRAAEISNYFVRALDRINNELSSKSAGYFRAYVEERYLESEREIAGILDSLQSFQERYGVFDLEAQTQAYFEQLAELRVNALQARIQFETLKSQFGANNVQVQAYREIVEAADRVYEAALSGKEQVLPVPQEEAPTMIRAYLDLTLNQTIQQRILELVAPMLEQARFEEQRQIEALQVVDAAVPPAKKFKPKRSIIVIAATMSAFILAVIYVLLAAWWKRNHRYFARRLGEAASSEAAIRE